MAEPVGPLIAFSDHVAVLVERVSASIVAVHGGGRWSSSGIHWRPGVIVTAEEALERDDELAVTLPGGRKNPRSLPRPERRSAPGDRQGVGGASPLR
jgi:hypothetical protein